MRMLLTNDDGVEAPGLAALERATASLGTTLVYAPNQALSGCSHQVTTDGPLRVTAVGPSRHAVSGTPADCVRLALLARPGTSGGPAVPEVDWVLSGINDGGNLGVDTLMSGTVGAAREAALLGRRAIAFSQYRRRKLPFDWSRATAMVAAVFSQLLRRPLPERCFWNVNLPHDPDGPAIPDLVFCPVDPHPLPVRYDQVDGAWHYRSDYHARQRKPGADVDVCFAGRIAISMISLDPS